MANWFGDAGHGGTDPGAVCGSLVEKAMNLIVALEWKVEMERHGEKVTLSRSDDRTLSLTQRCNMEKLGKYDYCISFHHNAGGGDGYEVYHTLKGGRGKELALKVAEEFKKIGQNPHGTGVKTRQSTKYPGKDYYTMIGDTRSAAIITEFCYLDSKDNNIADTIEELKSEGRAIAKACLKQIGKEYKEVIKEQPKSQSSDDKWYKIHIGAFRDRENALKLLDKAKEKGFVNVYMTIE